MNCKIKTVIFLFVFIISEVVYSQMDVFPICAHWVYDYHYRDVYLNNFDQLDSLGLTWVHGPDDPLQSYTIEFLDSASAHGMMVELSRGGEIAGHSREHRFIYEVEGSHWVQSYPGQPDQYPTYFDTTFYETGQPYQEGDVYGRVVVKDVDPMGYMVQYLENDWDWMLPDIGTHYLKPRLKITGDFQSSDPVVRFEIYNKDDMSLVLDDTVYADCCPPGEYVEMSIQFNKNFGREDSGETIGFLRGDETEEYRGSHMELRVYWFGGVTTYLDYLKIDHLEADSLFRGDYDTVIVDEINTYNRHYATARWYINDEPSLDQFLTFGYLNAILKKESTDSANYKAFGTTTVNKHPYLERFYLEGDPVELVVDRYPINVHVDFPSPEMPDGMYPIPPYNVSTFEQYNTHLQERFNEYLINYCFYHARNVSLLCDIPFWYVPQLHGLYYYGDNIYKILRNPTAEEISAMVNLSMTYGAKGIFYFLYITEDCGSGRYCTGLVPYGSTNHYSNFDTIYGVDVFTGYNNKWNAVQKINQDLKILGPILVELQSDNVGNEAESLPLDIVTDISGAFDIEIGEFSHQETGERYFMLVNKRCRPYFPDNPDSNDTQILDVIISNPYGSDSFILEDILSSRKPGYYEENRVAYRKLSGTNPQFTVTLEPGEGRLFRITSGLSGLITYDSYWSGDVLVAGDISVNNGVTLTIYPGTEILVQPYKKITVYGTFDAQGTSAYPITFTRSDPASHNTQFWEGIKVYDPGTFYLDYVKFYGAHYGIYTYGSGSITNSHFEENGYGIFCNQTYKIPIRDNTFINNQFAGIGNIYSYSIIYDNQFTGNMWGIFFSRSSGKISGNIMENSIYDGMFLMNSSGPSLSTGRGDDGSYPEVNNIIANNDRYGVFISSNSTPDLGTYGWKPGFYYAGGFNQFNHGSGSYDVYNNTSTMIPAEVNWWFTMDN